ncbi:hypothetical protein ABH920_009181 [Catenulispora sp. EB89]|uniref:hypothetical protein n=1 Tax=Catenulispora sp. EB89 TaxID=3156257 RepID=UPI0035167B42
MTAGAWSMASPLTLIRQWSDRGDEAPLHDLVLLGFTVDLPFLERVLISRARALGARVTVVGDVGHGLYEAIDVKLAGRSYFHGLAACSRAFHPKVVLLRGENDVEAAIGSGNPTAAGWGYNDEIWTVLGGTKQHGVPEALHQLATWLDELPTVVDVSDYIREILRENSRLLKEFPVADDDHRTTVLHNLSHSLLGQLPSGPVDELNMYAPFIDGTGAALDAIARRFDPSRVVVGVQPRRSSFDGDRICEAFAGRELEVRFLEDVGSARHGKLLEWRIGDSWHALTGSANLTVSALLRSTRDEGNCELAVLSSGHAESLMPRSDRSADLSELNGLRTVGEPTPSRASAIVLGVLDTSAGLAVTLARTYTVDVVVEASADGAPGGWTRLGTIPAGQSEGSFPVLETYAVVRVVATTADPAIAASPPVFVMHPAKCARRRANDDDRPTLRRFHDEDEFLMDEQAARQFQNDLGQLAKAVRNRRALAASVPTEHAETASAVELLDRWQAYLDQCEQMLGAVLTSKLFGLPSLSGPRPFGGSAWGLSVSVPMPEDSAAEEDAGLLADEGELADDDDELPPLPETARHGWRRWTERAADVVQEGVFDLAVRFLILRVVIQLLGRGAWGLNDDGWREPLAVLTEALAGGTEADDVEQLPHQARQVAAFAVAVGVGLLRQGTSAVAGGPADVHANEVWRRVRAVVATADPNAETDLLIYPRTGRARTLTRGALADLIGRAAADDPLADLQEALADQGLDLVVDGDLYRVAGGFRNPVPVAARVVTELGRLNQGNFVHVRATNGDRWAYCAWQRPELVLAVSRPTNSWRHYHLTQATATPESRFAAEEGLSSIGLTGMSRLGQVPPPQALAMLTGHGIDHIDLLRRLLD